MMSMSEAMTFEEAEVKFKVDRSEIIDEDILKVLEMKATTEGTSCV